MRSIKFRAWDGARMRYLENGDFIIEYSGISIFGKLEGRKSVDWELMQYTGLKDKNGKEIYKGDIVAIGKGKSLIGVIEYDAPSFIIIWKNGNKRAEIINGDREPIFKNSHISLQIIGNIYKNPELLEKKE